MKDQLTLDALFADEDTRMTQVREHPQSDFEHVVIDGHDFVHCKRCGDVVTRVDSEVCNDCYFELRDDYLEYLDEFHSSEKE